MNTILHRFGLPVLGFAMLFVMIPVSTAEQAVWPELWTLPGVKYSKARVQEIGEDAITIYHETGVAKIPFSEMVPEDRERLGIVWEGESWAPANLAETTSCWPFKDHLHDDALALRCWMICMEWWSTQVVVMGTIIGTDRELETAKGFELQLIRVAAHLYESTNDLADSVSIMERRLYQAPDDRQTIEKLVAAYSQLDAHLSEALQVGKDEPVVGLRSSVQEMTQKLLRDWEGLRDGYVRPRLAALRERMGDETRPNAEKPALETP